MTAAPPEGPFLYDDAPEPLHTGTPRRRSRLLLAVFGATVAAAVLAAVLLPRVKGSADDQAREAAGVFVAALAADDVETAYQMLCDAERARLTPERAIATYRHPGTGEVLGVSTAQLNGAPARTVAVRWSGDGDTIGLTVINESGPHVCGVEPAG